MPSRNQKPHPKAPGASRTRSRSKSPAAQLEASVSAIVASLRSSAKGLAGAVDPLEAELFASDIVSIWDSTDPDDEEPIEVLAHAVVARLASRPDPDMFAVLLGIAAMAPPWLSDAVRDAVASQRAAGTPEPVWSRIIGQPALVDAWISTDKLDDQSNLLAAFAYDRRPPHALNMIIDANFGGLIRSAFVSGDPDAVRKRWKEVSGLPIRALDEQGLADVLGRGIQMFEEYLDPPVDEEAENLMPLLRARLGLLPAPRDIEPREIPNDERELLVADFAASPEAAGLPVLAEGSVPEIAAWLVDFACDAGAGDPLRWSPIAVEILLADWLPEKAILSPSEIDAAPEVLRRFIRFAAERKGLAEADFAETLEAVDRFAPDFADGMADDDAAGPGKELARDLLASGIDLNDAAAIERWIDARNEAIDRGRTFGRGRR